MSVVPAAGQMKPPSRVKAPSIRDAAPRESVPEAISSVALTERLLTASSRPPKVTTGFAAPRSMTTSSPAAGTVPVLHLVGSNQEPLASVFQETVASN